MSDFLALYRLYAGRWHRRGPPPEDRNDPSRDDDGRQRGTEGRHVGDDPLNGAKHPVPCSSSGLEALEGPESSSSQAALPVEVIHGSNRIQNIREEQLKFDKVLGEDPGTKLYLGEWFGGGMISGATLQQVAIRALKPECPPVAIDAFWDELDTVGVFAHPNVIRLLGVTYIEKQYLAAVYDYSIHGDLVEFLKVREPRDGSEEAEQERARNAEDFLRIAAQIVEGMDYLSTQQRYVHRDLAARNCLVGDQQVVKIGDFARLRPQYDRDYYQMPSAAARNARVPLRWLAKEVLDDGRYGPESDVHAFGVTLWEIYTYSKRPYGEQTSDAKVLKWIQEGRALEIPEFIPNPIYCIIMDCQKPNPARRPTFSELRSQFQSFCADPYSEALQLYQHRAVRRAAAPEAGSFGPLGLLRNVQSKINSSLGALQDGWALARRLTPTAWGLGADAAVSAASYCCQTAHLPSWFYTPILIRMRLLLGGTDESYNAQLQEFELTQSKEQIKRQQQQIALLREENERLRNQGQEEFVAIVPQLLEQIRDDLRREIENAGNEGENQEENIQ